MMEIPEASTLAKQLKENFLGKMIIMAEAAHTHHGFTWYFGDPKEYSVLLEGKVINEVAPIAGQLEIHAGDVRIVLHDGVNVRYCNNVAKAPAKHQLLLGFSDGVAMVCTVQMYGGICAFIDGANDNKYYLVAKEKPNPLTDEFNEAYFERILSMTDFKFSAKALLATEQRIPGLGNGCLQDILFNAGVNPQTKIKFLSDEKKKALFISTKKTLLEMTTAGGRDTEKNLFGKPGGYKTILSSKTLNKPCPVCNAAIVRKPYLGGNVYFCPTCQPVMS